MLDKMLAEFDTTGPQLLSIASVDRVRAYYQAITAIALATLLIQIGLYASGFPISMVVIWLLNIVPIWLCISAVRAWRYWSGRGSGRMLPVLDFFLRRALSQDFRSLHVLWAPIWEELLFRVLIGLVPPILIIAILPSLAGVITPEGELASGVSRRLQILIIVAFTGVSIWAFWAAHKPHYLEVKRLRRRLLILDRNRELERLGHITLGQDDKRIRTEVLNRLWVLTGNARYRREGEGETGLTHHV
jgi:hypothetical protein